MVDESLCRFDVAAFGVRKPDRCRFPEAVGNAVPAYCDRLCGDDGSQCGVATVDELNWLRSYRYSPRAAELTSTQQLVIQLVACGLSDKEIAYFLGITSATVKAHNAAVLRAFGFHRRAQLVRFVFENKWFDPEEAQRALEARRKPRRARRAS